jgi:hypothetical protein
MTRQERSAEIVAIGLPVLLAAVAVIGIVGMIALWAGIKSGAI